MASVGYHLGGKIFFWILLIQTVAGSGKLQITLHSYVFEYNAKGGNVNTKDQASDPAESFNKPNKVYTPLWQLTSGRPDIRNSTVMTSDWPWTTKANCSAPPQYMFLICLDYEESFDPGSPCSLQRVTTRQIRIDRSPFSSATLGRETVTFPPVLGMVDGNFILNPVSFDFPSWESPVRLSVYITCCGDQDFLKGQCNEVLSATMQTSPKALVEGTQTILYTLTGRGSLMLSASAICDSSYYGPSCDIYCLVSNPSAEHKFCNSTTGNKQCLKGWTDSDCQTDINECDTVKCQNQGTCRNLPGSYMCQCPLGTKGSFCEQRVPVCYMRPCQNQGTCMETGYGSLCMCPPGYDGQWCNEVIPPSMTVASTVGPVMNMTTPLPISHQNWRNKGGSVVECLTRQRATFLDIDVKADNRLAEQGRNSGWKNWYLAIILGVSTLLLILVTLVVFRKRVQKRYKISLAASSQEDINNKSAKPPIPKKGRQFNNAVYHTSESGNVIHNIFHPRHDEDRRHSQDYCNVLTYRSLQNSASASTIQTVESDELPERYSRHPVLAESHVFEPGKLNKNNVNKENDARRESDAKENESAVAIKKALLPPTIDKNIALDENPLKFNNSVSGEEKQFVSAANSFNGNPQPVANAPDDSAVGFKPACGSVEDNVYELVVPKPELKPKPLPRSIYRTPNASHDQSRLPLGGNAYGAGKMYNSVPVDEDGYCVPVTSGGVEIEVNDIDDDWDSDSSFDDFDSVQGDTGKPAENIYVQYCPRETSSPLEALALPGCSDNGEESVYSIPSNRPSLHLRELVDDEASVYANVSRTPTTENFDFPLDENNYLEPVNHASQQSVYANMAAFEKEHESDSGGYVNYSNVPSLTK